jgi:O-antigen ligase
MNLNKYTYNYFLFLFSIIPLTLIVGSSASFINIFLIDLSFIILIFYKKNFLFLKNKTIIYLFILYIYLIFNSFVSIDYSEGILRNLGFLRIIILFVAFNYFYYEKFFFKKMFNFWLLILSIVVFDVFVEYFNGKNILGYNASGYGKRIVSFFKDEPIVGGFLNSFFLVLTGFFLNQGKKYKYYIFLLIAIYFISILVTTERSSSIKALIGISIFFLFYKELNLKNKVISFFLICLVALTFVLNSHKIKHRYTVQLKQVNIYYGLYKSGFQVFKNNKIFGVGNKNYRVATCNQDKVNTSNQNKYKYICNTHPHQVYLVLLSEHGLIGTFIILFIFYKLIFSKIRKTILEKNYLKIGALIYLVLSFLPIIPSGAFFSSFSLTLFALNLSIFYASDENMNIFKIK